MLSSVNLAAAAADTGFSRDWGGHAQPTPAWAPSRNTHDTTSFAASLDGNGRDDLYGILPSSFYAVRLQQQRLQHSIGDSVRRSTSRVLADYRCARTKGCQQIPSKRRLSPCLTHGPLLSASVLLCLLVSSRADFDEDENIEFTIEGDVEVSVSKRHSYRAHVVCFFAPCTCAVVRRRSPAPPSRKSSSQV